jgi:hypothetical protein
MVFFYFIFYNTNWTNKATIELIELTENNFFFFLFKKKSRVGTETIYLEEGGGERGANYCGLSIITHDVMIKEMYLKNHMHIPRKAHYLVI